ncbi:cytochrome c oxidase subunit II [Stappia sp.]|uniref:cytochrome c oxidase subunit II n=1 Tax=Stappia sp. TaxID=1870903 RepID=UPI0032D92DDA
MTELVKRLTTIGAAGLAALLGFAAAAQAAQPTPWQMGMQPSATEVMSDIRWFNGFTLTIITVITLFVLALLLWCIFRFNAKSNPSPSRTSHNTMIEVVWTVVPIIILVVIAIPSFRLLYKEATIPPFDMTVKATGLQWAWSYEYMDEGSEGIILDSYMLRGPEALAEKAAATGRPIEEYPRLLAVDYEMVVPVDTVVRVQVTAADVLHSFAMPAFGLKMDAVPGRLNETWFRADRTGIYYGQCSELCGKDHAFMPIAIRVVEQDQFQAWVEAAKDDVDAANEQLMAAINAAEPETAAAATDEDIEVAAR